ncbi:unnamed protein product [Rotaria sp. Silwood1]|nr:unnamed protein product [Rotaria sp. Silwood1]CAF4790968.1 unnamed protein product [Rotaria sp. Silwood1]
MPRFESCMHDAKVASIMYSYNSVNGVPSCANQFILETIARESHHLRGFVVSDYGVVSTIMNENHYTSIVEDTVTTALHAGQDFNCGDFYSSHTQAVLDRKNNCSS